MNSFRKAVKSDFPAIELLLNELGIGHPSIANEDFWVAKIDGGLAGIVNVKDCGGCFYVGAVGVRPSLWRRGIASALLDEVLPVLNKPAYLYTKIPDFFSRFGFAEAKPPREIPPRDIYDCTECNDSTICFCMMRA